MRSNYKKLGLFIRQIDIRNLEGKEDNLLGVSTQKFFIPSIANTYGTDFTKYKVVKKNQFTYVPDTSRRGDKIGLAMLNDYNQAIVSQAYTVFEVIDHNELDPEYLMMWFRRTEFDRYARYKSHGSVREVFDWDEMCEVELPVPPIEKQRAIVKEYNTVVNRIKLNEQLNQKLEETAQALYKHWFVDFEFPISKEYAQKVGKPELEGKPYNSSGGEMILNEELEKEIPEEWEVVKLVNRTSKIGSGSTPRGGKGNYKQSGISLIRSMNVHDFRFEYSELAYIDQEQAKKLNNVKVEVGDVLFNITGASIARCSMVPDDILPARVNQHVAIIRLDEPLFSGYLLCALCSNEYKRRLIGLSESGSTREAITKEDIENFEILFPSEITLNDFSKKIDLIFENRRKNIQQNVKLMRLKDLILSKMTQAEVEEKEVVG